MTGYIIKVAFVMLTAWVIDFNTVVEDDGEGTPTLVLHYD